MIYAAKHMIADYESQLLRGSDDERIRNWLADYKARLRALEDLKSELPKKVKIRIKD